MSTISNELLAYLASIHNNSPELSRETVRHVNVGTEVENSPQTTEEAVVNEQTTTTLINLTELNGAQFEEYFVEDVRSYQCLWDTTSRSYKDTQMKAKAWDTLAEKYGRNADELKRMWKNFKENFSKCLKKRELMTRSGAPAASLPECKLFNQLQFFKDKVLNRPTVSNIPQASTSQYPQDRIESVVFQPISPDAPAPSPSPSLESNSSQPRKRKGSKTPTQLSITEKDHPDNFLYEALQEKEDKDADQSFADSIVPILRGLPPKKNCLAKVDIQQILLKYEFDEDE